jgi:hypothetical protein
MKINLTFKSPDVLSDAIDNKNLTDSEREAVEELAENFLEYGEYVTIQLDTKAKTAVVLPVVR